METTTQSMSYGVLPTREAFDEAFNRECPNGYNIRCGSTDSRALDGFKLGDGTWTADELWEAIREIVETSDGDAITVSEDEEFEDVYQVFYSDSDKPFVEIGPDPAELIEWAQKFSSDHITSQTRAVECLNFAAAYGSIGKCYLQQDAADDLVSSILETLGFEWI